MNVPILISLIILFAAATLLVVLFFKQLKGILALFLNTVMGWAGLYIFNLIFAATGFTIGINIASASIAGVLGLPGLVLMVILKLLYK